MATSNRITLSPTSQRPAPLSSAQARLWFVHQVRPPSSEYNLQLAYRLRGKLRPAALVGAVRAIVARHEPLRTVIATADGSPMQRVLPDWSPRVDRRPAPAGASDDDRAVSVVNEELAKVFDLGAAPPIAVRLATLRPDDVVLAVTLHHIVFDGWSTARFVAELAEAYQRLIEGQEPDLGELPVSYSDYAWWERELLRVREAELLDFWRGELAGVEDLRLPTDRAGHGVGAAQLTERTSIAPATYRRVVALARDLRTSPFVVGIAAYAALLHRYGGQTDFVLAMPVAGRTEVALEPLIGCFVNTVCVRASVRPADTFQQLVTRTRDRLVAAMTHQQLPFDRLVHELRPDRRSDRNPLFRAFCSAVDALPPPLALPGLQAELVVPEYRQARFDLNATFLLTGDNPAVQLDLSEAVFSPATAARLASHLGVLLDWAVAQPARRVSDIPLLLPAERRRVLALTNPEGGT